eukprot:g13936.t1
MAAAKSYSYFGVGRDMNSKLGSRKGDALVGAIQQGRLWKQKEKAANANVLKAAAEKVRKGMPIAVGKPLGPSVAAQPSILLPFVCLDDEEQSQSSLEPRRISFSVAATPFSSASRLGRSASGKYDYEFEYRPEDQDEQVVVDAEAEGVEKQKASASYREAVAQRIRAERNEECREAETRMQELEEDYQEMKSELSSMKRTLRKQKKDGATATATLKGNVVRLERRVDSCRQRKRKCGMRLKSLEEPGDDWIEMWIDMELKVEARASG